jgi:hypothetical protein
MKQIIIKLLTEKGEKAYKEISSVKQTFKDRMITSKIFSEKIIGTNPLTIHIDIKIEWLADKIEIDKKIIDTMIKYDCKPKEDYTIMVVK